MFPRVKMDFEGRGDEYEGASAAVAGVLSGLTRKFDSPAKFPEHELFVHLNAISSVEVTVSRADAKRLAKYQVIAIRRQKGRFGFHLPRSLFHRIHPGASGDSDLLGGLEDVSSLRKPTLKRDVKRRLWLEQRKNCAACGNIVPTLDEATLDHSLPQSMHGTDTLANLSVTCARCNEKKDDDLPYDLSSADVILDAYSLQEGLWRPQTG